MGLNWGACKIKPMARPINKSRRNAKLSPADLRPKSKASPASSHLEVPPGQLAALVALYNQRRFKDVLASATATAAEFPSSVILHNILGAAHVELGNLDGAIASFGKAIQIKPDFFEAHNNLGLALQHQWRFKEAIVAFQQALRIRSDDAETHNNLGKVLQIQGRLDEAAASFGNAVRINPRFVEAHSNLCGLYERQNRLADLENALGKATFNCGEEEPTILYRLAQLASRRNQFEIALGYLQKAPIERIQASQKTACLNLRGRVCDKLGRFSEAFSAFARQNKLARNTAEARRYNADRYLNSVLARNAAWTASAETSWSDLVGGSTPISPAFLVGFPRSGTTLLDSILRGHSQLAVVEEKPMVRGMTRAITKAFGQMPTAQVLNALSEANIAGLKDLYFNELKKHLEEKDEGKLVIDKLPLNIVEVDIIKRIFPDTKIILALRHPCDCVLSCFMQSFRLNNAMANFLSLEQSAKLYVAVMELWFIYRQKLNLRVHSVKYEELVQDPESTCRSLFGFLGVEWDEKVLNYQEVALDRGKIKTPSYNQVVQPIYTNASGRWMNYREQMESVLPVLQPWIDALGY